MRNWDRFFDQWQKDVRLWFFFMSYFLLFRIIFILLFHDQINPQSTYFTIFAAVLNGMRYDSVIVTLLTLIPFLFTIAAGFAELDQTAEKARMVVGTVFLISSTVICFVTFTYFYEFGDQFNHFLSGLIYDDLQATIITVIKEYHLAANILAMTAAIFIFFIMMRLFISRSFISREFMGNHLGSIPVRVVTTIVILLLFAVGARGSVGRVPVRERNAAITSDAFLNKTVLNPYTALRYAIREQIRLSRVSGLEIYLPDKDMCAAAQYAFSTDRVFNDLDQYMITHAKGRKGDPPRHIFLVVAESYSAWPMWEQYHSLHIADGVKGLAREGISFERFISSSGGTMSSLCSIVTGLPDAGIITNYRQSARGAYPTSMGKIFKDLGYTTRFFYGGYLSWQRVGDFCKDQGFEEIYGGGDIGSWLSANEWGVDDEYLFDFVFKTVRDDTPSFNLILTTSYHPPYDIDVRAKGFSLTEIPQDLKSLCVEDVDLKMLGHFWYTDHYLGEFAKNIERHLPKTLIAITADNASRKKVVKNPGLFEKTAVPFVLYGKDVLDGIDVPDNASGSHLDVISTLVELAAPKGFTYHTMGKNLLDPDQRLTAIGQSLVLGPDYIADVRKEPKIYPLPGYGSAPPTPVGEIKKLHDAYHGIAWWRIMHGPNI